MKIDTYLKNVKKHQDKNGFIGTSHCDALLFSGLMGCHPSVDVDLLAARDESGKWHRRPNKDCFATGGSKTSISRDMLLGVIYWAYHNNKPDVLDDLIKYAFKNRFVMGDSHSLKDKFGRCVITPNLLSLAALALKKLGGKNYWYLTWIPMVATSKVGGFQAHLAVLDAILRGEIKGKKYKIVYEYAEKQPMNPMFQYAAGNIEEAKSLLSNEKYWPNRSPNTHDRYESWLPQRDFGPDWMPDKEFEEHHGGDYIFLHYLIYRK